MRNTVLSYLLLPLFASLPLALHAAPVVPPAVSASLEVEAGAMKTNLNTADATALQKNLNGIGKAKAEAIVAYREANGPFQAVDELLEIKGIGNALMERNRERLAVE
ncbi:ComE operon protein 1 [compost metagenome]